MIDIFPDDLAKSNSKVIVFEGENSVEYFNDPGEKYHDQFLDRIKEMNPVNDKQDEWADELFGKINNQEAALVSDQAFLDYHFATKSHLYPNLYRSTNDQLIMPYFLPVTYHNSPQQLDTINKMYVINWRWV